MKATQTWLKVWQRGETGRKFNKKTEECEHEEHDKMFQAMKRLRWIVENMINKKSHELSRAFLDLRSLVMFSSFEVALAFGSCSCEKITRAIHHEMHDFLYLYCFDVHFRLFPLIITFLPFFTTTMKDHALKQGFTN